MISPRRRDFWANRELSNLGADLLWVNSEFFKLDAAPTQQLLLQPSSFSSWALFFCAGRSLFLAWRPLFLSKLRLYAANYGYCRLCGDFYWAQRRLFSIRRCLIMGDFFRQGDDCNFLRLVAEFFCDNREFFLQGDFFWANGEFYW